jgi:tRNA(Ile)-lysidine synthase
LNVPLEVGRADVAQLAASQGDGFEAAARSARYEFLRQTAERLGARFVATAHTADDQVETVLHRILRGTGLAGLVGIPAHRPLSRSVTVIRPLLAVRRQQVLEYLNAIGQDYRTDTSNFDPRFTRNRLRNELLPLLRDQYNAEVDAALLRLAAQADETKQLIGDLAVRLAHQCVEPIHDSQAIRIDCRALAAQPDLIVREVLKIAWDHARGPRQDMGLDEWQQLANLAKAHRDVPAVNLPGNIRARRDGDGVILEPLDVA